jgi:hypothetical protein
MSQFENQLQEGPETTLRTGWFLYFERQRCWLISDLAKFG